MWMLTAQKSLKQKNSDKIVSWRNVFFIFCLRTFPLQWCLFYLFCKKYQKNWKIQVIWDLGRGNPATLGRKNRTCHVMAPPVLTWRWRIQLLLTVSCVQRRGGRGPLTWQLLAQRLNVSFNLSKKVNIVIYIIANLAGNIKNIETYCVNRDCVEGPVTTPLRGRGEGVRHLMARSH